MQRATSAKPAIPGQQRPEPADRTGTAHPRAVLTIILVSYLMIVLDISIVITTLPKMVG